MPGAIGLRFLEQLKKTFHNLIGKVLCQALSDAAEALGSIPPHFSVVVLKRIEKHFDDGFELVEVYLVLVEHFFIGLFLVFFVRAAVTLKVVQGP